MKKLVLLLGLVVLTTGSHAATRYQQLSKIFQDAFRPKVEDYTQSETLWVGKCVSQNRPEQLQRGTLNGYQQGDEVIGIFHKMRIVSPFSSGFENVDFSELDTDKHMFHRKTEGNLATVSEMKQADSAVGFHVYSDEERNNLRETVVIRVGRNEAGLTFLIVQATPNGRSSNSYFCYFTRDILSGLHF